MYIPDYLLSLCTAFYIKCLLSHDGPERIHWASRWARSGAKYSYSLYLLHFPLLTFIASFYFARNLWRPTADHITILVLIFLAVNLYAYGIARCTEFKTEPIRAYLEKRLFKSKSLAAASGA